MSVINVIIRAIWRAIFGERRASPDAVAAFYADCSTLTSFAAKLANLGFSWKSDGMNLMPGIDTEAEPALVIQRKWGNCNDAMRLFREFMFSKNIHFKLTEFYLWKQVNLIAKDWHYIGVYEIDGSFYLQSNFTVQYVIDIASALSRPEAAFPHQEVYKRFEN